MDKNDRSPPRWDQDIRDHWAGVEIRNHWRRDAIWMEDKTRSRRPNVVGALALLRNAILALVIPELDDYGGLPAFTESIQAKPNHALKLICRKL